MQYSSHKLLPQFRKAIRRGFTIMFKCPTNK